MDVERKKNSRFNLSDSDATRQNMMYAERMKNSRCNRSDSDVARQKIMDA